jgi:hypothetical protein
MSISVRSGVPETAAGQFRRRGDVTAKLDPGRLYVASVASAPRSTAASAPCTSILRASTFSDPLGEKGIERTDIDEVPFHVRLLYRRCLRAPCDTSRYSRASFSGRVPAAREIKRIRLKRENEPGRADPRGHPSRIKADVGADIENNHSFRRKVTDHGEFAVLNDSCPACTDERKSIALGGGGVFEDSPARA